MTDRVIAALYVQEDGVYYGLEDVDPWPEERDARGYQGPYPVIAHPPCARWGRYWSGGPSAKVRRELGDDGGCFEAALRDVRRWGGVIEHPADSHAWGVFGINKPPRSGKWIAADFFGGWTCCVEQGQYGHPSRKATWLYACHTDLPELRWGPSGDRMRLDEGFRTKEAAQAARGAPDWRPVQRLSRNQRIRTPIEFRDMLLDLARSVYSVNIGERYIVDEADLPAAKKESEHVGEQED